jgi:hypothetical protein
LAQRFTALRLGASPGSESDKHRDVPVDLIAFRMNSQQTMRLSPDPHASEIVQLSNVAFS